MALSAVGCKGKSKSSDASIYINQYKNEMTFSKVTFYDFCYYEKCDKMSGDCYLDGYSLSATEIGFTDPDGELREMHINKALGDRPKEIKVYTNFSETSSETYKMTY